MSKKLSFKEYLESKEVLRQAIDDIPKEEIVYDVKKYCTLPILDESRKIPIKLKPNNRLFISWLYEDKRNPKAVRITFEGTDTDNTSEKSAWDDAKLLKWLLNNTNRN